MGARKRFHSIEPTLNNKNKNTVNNNILQIKLFTDPKDFFELSCHNQNPDNDCIILTLVTVVYVRYGADKQNHVDLMMFMSMLFKTQIVSVFYFKIKKNIHFSNF